MLIPKKGRSDVYKRQGDDNSDIDIAIISSKLFEFVWEKIRIEYSIKYKMCIRDRK